MRVPADVRAAVVRGRLTKASARDSNLRALACAVAAVVPLVVAARLGTAIGWAVAWLVSGVLVSGTFAAVHEAIHGSLYRSRTANDVAGVLWGLVVLNPYASYRPFHFQHHVHTHEPGDSEPPLRVTNVGGYLLVFPLAMVGLNALLWWELVRIVAGHPPVYARRTARRGLAVVNLVALVAVVAGLAVWAVRAPGAFASWWLAPVLVGSVLAALYSTPEHYGTAFGPASPFAVSRTIRSNPVTRWVIWNANYHVAHHLCPTVTGRNLGRLQEVIDDRCEVRARSYTRFHAGLVADLSRGRVVPPVPDRMRKADQSAIEAVDAARPGEYAEAAGDRDVDLTAPPGGQRQADARVAATPGRVRAAG